MSGGCGVVARTDNNNMIAGVLGSIDGSGIEGGVFVLVGVGRPRRPPQLLQRSESRRRGRRKTLNISHRVSRCGSRNRESKEKEVGSQKREREKKK